jgi:hypothetical protein
VSILCMCCSHFSWYCFISFKFIQFTHFVTFLRSLDIEIVL